MNLHVQTYNNPSDLNIEALNKNKKVLHICATPSLTQAMINNANIKATNGTNVISVKWFIDAILDEWMNIETKLLQIVGLSEIVRKSSPNNIEERNITKSMRKNKADVLLTIRMLTEMNINPLQFQDIAKTKYEKELCNIWSELFEQPSIKKTFQDIKEIIAKINNPDVTKDFINEKLLKKFENEIENEHLKVRKESLNLNNMIVLHGFYFISPIQQEIFKALERANVKIIFLQFYDEKHPEIFSFLEDTLGHKNRWLDQKKWKTISTNLANDRSVFFSNNFKKTKLKIDVEEPGVFTQEFNTFTDLFEEINNVETNDKVTYLSVISDQFNDKLKGFYPDLFNSEKNFLSYPIGQYINILHKVWNQEFQKERISIIMLQESFNSPWLSYKNEYNETIKASNFQHLLEELKEFLPYFMSLDELRAAVQKLIIDIENAPFINRSSINNNRFIDEIMNPVKKLSPYKINPNELEIVLTFIDKMKEHMNLLFSEGSQFFSFKDYFKVIQGLINNELTFEELNKEEKELIRKVEDIAFKYQSEITMDKYHIENFAESINLLLSSKLEKDDEVVEGSNIKKIKTFEEIDGEIFNSNSIHVTGLDEFSFPDIKSALPWPLTINAVKRLELINPSFQSMLLREENKDRLPRYLFCLLLSNKQKITLSWLSNWNGSNSLKSSNYVKLMENISVKIENDYLDLDLDLSESLIKEIFFDEVDFTKTKFNEYPDYALSELNICNRRFYYSYVTQRYSAFRSDFHFGFLFNNIYNLLLKFDELPVQQINEVFPYWSRIKKEIKIANFQSFFDSMDSKVFSFNNFSYKAYSGTKYLIRQKADADLQWNAAWNNKGFNIHGKLDLLKANPSDKCRYCPHEFFCPAARYSIDDERNE